MPGYLSMAAQKPGRERMWRDQHLYVPGCLQPVRQAAGLSDRPQQSHTASRTAACGLVWCVTSQYLAPGKSCEPSLQHNDSLAIFPALHIGSSAPYRRACSVVSVHRQRIELLELLSWDAFFALCGTQHLRQNSCCMEIPFLPAWWPGRR